MPSSTRMRSPSHGSWRRRPSTCLPCRRCGRCSSRSVTVGSRSPTSCLARGKRGCDSARFPSSRRSLLATTAWCRCFRSGPWPRRSPRQISDHRPRSAPTTTCAAKRPRGGLAHGELHRHHQGQALPGPPQNPCQRPPTSTRACLRRPSSMVALASVAAGSTQAAAQVRSGSWVLAPGRSGSSRPRC